MTGGASLPSELVATILDHADIHQLVVVSHVCALWRTAAHAHPIFWHNVALHQLSLGAASLFEARLRSKRGHRGINVSILIKTDTGDGCSLLKSVALPAIQRNLGRIVRLSLLLPKHSIAECFNFMGRPAPMLTSLALAATGGRIHHIFPHTADRLFNGFAPELRTLELANVFLVTSTGPCVISDRIETLRLVSNGNLPVHLPGLLAQFPSLQHVNMYVLGCARNQTDTFSIEKPLLSFRLRLHYGGYDGAFICFADLGKITHLSCWLDSSHTQHTISMLLRVFDARPLKLSLLDNGAVPSRRGFGITFSAPHASRGHTRTVYVRTDEAGMPVCREQLRTYILSPEIRARVSRLRVPARQIALTGFVEELPVCEVLEIALDDGLPPQTDGHWQVLRLPTLRTLVLCTSGPGAVSVAGDDLVAFLQPLVGDKLAPPLEIQRDNVRIVGDTTSLAVNFAHLSS